jgi:ATP-dependent helicase/nuclease subunit B
VGLRPLLLLVPSRAAAVELPRRLASTGRALAAVYAMKPLELAQALAAPALLGGGLRAWDAGHDALLAARLLSGREGASLRLPAGAPLAPVSSALARTLQALRRAGVPPRELQHLAEEPGRAEEDARRLAALATLHEGFQAALADAADPVRLYGAAREALAGARWLDEADVVLTDDLELDPAEAAFVAALAAHRPVRILRRVIPPGLQAAAFRRTFAGHGVHEAAWCDTPLAALAPAEPPVGLRRLRDSLFEPPAGVPVEDGSVELVSASGEAAEARAIARRLLREAARGVAFEEMAVVLPRPDTYAPLLTDLLTRLAVPHRLHPSLPLRFGRAARSLLLLLRCRGLDRPAVMEFLTFAPVPFEALLGAEKRAVPSRWDQISRAAGIVSGLSRWMLGLRALAEAEREAAADEEDADRRERRLRSAGDAEALLHVVEILSATLDGLTGEAPWRDWVDRLRVACEQWIGPERDREAVLEVIADLGSLGTVATRAPWDEVEQVLEARFDWERVPLEPLETGGVHIGALDAIAGLPFRIVAIPGLVEGGYPGVFRPDPFLLDAEREALAKRLQPAAPPGPARGVAKAAAAPPPPGRVSQRSAKRSSAQLALFADGPEATPQAVSRGATPEAASASTAVPLLPTTQDRLLEARRLFHRAVSQAGERLVLSYPRADARTGRERLPSLFFAAAAAALAGRPLAGADLDRWIREDSVDRLALDDTLDEGERDRVRLLRETDAAGAIAAGSVLFRHSRLATRSRWSNRLTGYDGFVGEMDDALRAQLDPLRSQATTSASRLATYARCGFLYLLQHVLRLQPAPEPEERRRLEPLERGDLFHRVAEAFLRERRVRGELPLRDAPELRERLRDLAEQALEGLVHGAPPRFTLLWQREKRRFHETVQVWFTREVAQAERARPAHFELSFGLGQRPDADEPHSPEPLEIELGDGRVLRVCGKIDRIDRRDTDGLVLRDYKTGRAPKDDGGVFRGGRQMQIPFYVLAAANLFPGETVVDAFLDYVDGGRQVAFRPELARGLGGRQVAFRPELARSPAFRRLLGELVSLVAGGVFVQEPAACEFCDFKDVCGPAPLLARRREIKARDPRLLQYLRLRDVG